MSRMMLQLFVGLLFVSPVSAFAEPELGPPPREVQKLIRIDTIKSGYQITLSREGAELVRDGLTLLGDGKAVTDIAKKAAKKRNDPELDKQIDFLALIMKTQAPAIRKALDEKMGPNGAIIKIFGIEKKAEPKLALLKSVSEVFLPEDWKDVLKTGMTVINTKPLWWQVEGRK